MARDGDPVSAGEHMSERELAAVLTELLDPGAETLPLGATLDTLERQMPKVSTDRHSLGGHTSDEIQHKYFTTASA